MGCTTNAISRLVTDRFYQRVIRGTLLDVGAGNDPLYMYRGRFPAVTAWTVIDTVPAFGPSNGPEWIVDDAADIPPGRTFDCIYSSHCLEHVDDPERVVTAWWRALNPGGHLHIMVPSWWTYERGMWPSARNLDHRTAWVPCRYAGDNWPAHVRGVIQSIYNPCTFAKRDASIGTDVGFTGPDAELVRLTTLDEGFNADAWDQTMNGTCESAIEIVIAKR